MAAIPTYLSAALSGGVDPFWPHLVLLSVSVLCGIAVGAGIIFEAPEYSSATHRKAKWLVISGVAVEAVCTVCLFVFDEGISGAQQDKIIMLEQRLAPRSLDAEQRARIIGRIAPFGGTHFVGYVATSPEPLALAHQIIDCLTSAGWQVDAPAPPAPRLNGAGLPPLGQAISFGVRISFDGARDASLKDAATTLAAVLDAEGIGTSLDAANRDDPGSNVIVQIGEKPR
jgi:hypothetical protein